MGHFKVSIALFFCIFVTSASGIYPHWNGNNPIISTNPSGQRGNGNQQWAGSKQPTYRMSRLNHGGYGSNSGYYGGISYNECACMLYVGQTRVFRRRSDRQFRCSFEGLESCNAHCTRLFSDEGLRTQSRQEACDVLGRPIHTNWFRRDQVCGIRRDVRLSTALCCRRGRTSLECTNPPSG